MLTELYSQCLLELLKVKIGFHGEENQAAINANIPFHLTKSLLYLILKLFI